MNKTLKISNTSFMENIEKRKEYWKYISYFIIYSFIGCLLETTFGLITKGVVESRQSFLFGPFCVIYGIGAVLIIKLLDKSKGKFLKIFFVSCIIGTLTEFLMSYFCEIIFHFKWWDYSEMKGNLAGRTCLYFSTMWGILGVILIQIVNPFLNKVLEFIENNVSHQIVKISICLIVGFLILDAGISYIGLKSFYAKIVNDFDMDLKQSEYPELSVENKLFEEDNMLLIYPNMQIAGTKYNNTYIDSLYKNRKMYYFRVFSKK